eukprot:gene25209-10854_t
MDGSLPKIFYPYEDYADIDADFGMRDSLGLDADELDEFWLKEERETVRIMELMDAAYEASQGSMRGDVEEYETVHELEDLLYVLHKIEGLSVQEQKHLRGTWSIDEKLTGWMRLTASEKAVLRNEFDSDNVHDQGSFLPLDATSTIPSSREQHTTINYFIYPIPSVAGTQVDQITLIALLLLTFLMTIFLVNGGARRAGALEKELGRAGALAGRTASGTVSVLLALPPPSRSLFGLADANLLLNSR